MTVKASRFFHTRRGTALSVFENDDGKQIDRILFNSKYEGVSAKAPLGDDSRITGYAEVIPVNPTAT